MSTTKYMINDLIVNSLMFAYDNMTFEETKELDDNVSDQEHLLRMATLEADLMFIKIIKQRLKGNEFTLVKLKYEIGKLFGTYELVYNKALPKRAVEEADNTIERCIRTGIFKEAT